MKFSNWIIVILLFAASVPELWAEGVKRWRDDRIRYLNALGERPAHEEFMSAAGSLGVGEWGDQMTPEHREVFERAKIVILSLRGHAEYFGNEIEAAIEGEFFEAAGKGGVYPSRPRCFSLIEHLQSPEVVALLGDLLEDDRDPWVVVPPGEISHGRPPPNSYLAAKTLNRMGIEGVPIIEIRSGDGDYESARDQWKLWYAAVKAGNRTFRFKGDPREYTLSGPVAETAAVAATPPTLSPPAAAPRGPGDSREGGNRAVPWLTLTVALGVLGLAARAVLASRRRKT